MTKLLNSYTNRLFLETEEIAGGGEPRNEVTKFRDSGKGVGGAKSGGSREQRTLFSISPVVNGFTNSAFNNKYLVVVNIEIIN